MTLCLHTLICPISTKNGKEGKGQKNKKAEISVAEAIKTEEKNNNGCKNIKKHLIDSKKP